MHAFPVELWIREPAGEIVAHPETIGMRPLPRPGTVISLAQIGRAGDYVVEGAVQELLYGVFRVLVAPLAPIVETSDENCDHAGTAVLVDG